MIKKVLRKEELVQKAHSIDERSGIRMFCQVYILVWIFLALIDTFLGKRYL